MSFTYNFDTAPDISYVRLLISDTQEFQADGTTRAYVFADDEINAFFTIQRMQFQSAQFYSYPNGRNLPTSPVSYLRVAALALSSIASNNAKLSLVTKLLDVTLTGMNATSALRDLAAEYRQIDDEAGAFFVIEQCPTFWSFRDRFWSQWQRQSGG